MDDVLTRSQEKKKPGKSENEEDPIEGTTEQIVASWNKA